MARIKRGLLRGSKFSDSHSTVIKAAIPIVEAVKRDANIRKIVLGPIVWIGSGARRITFTPIRAGLRMVVRGSALQQTFFVYTGDPRGVEQRLHGIWNRERR